MRPDSQNTQFKISSVGNTSAKYPRKSESVFTNIVSYFAMIEVKNGTLATSETFQLIELFENMTKDSKVSKYLTYSIVIDIM